MGLNMCCTAQKECPEKKREKGKKKLRPVKRQTQNYSSQSFNRESNLLFFQITIKYFEH